MARTLKRLAEYKRQWRATHKSLYARHEQKRLQKKNAWRRQRDLSGKAIAFKSFKDFFDYHDPVSVVQNRHLTDPVFVIIGIDGKRTVERLTDPLPVW